MEEGFWETIARAFRYTGRSYALLMLLLCLFRTQADAPIWALVIMGTLALCIGELASRELLNSTGR
jgi:hypothetical protein